MSANTTYLHELKHTLSLAGPLVAAHVIQALSPFLGVMMLGELSTAALAASGLVSAIFIAVIALFLGMLNAVAILIAQSHGAKDTKKINVIVRQGFMFALLISLPQIILFLTLPLVLEWTNQPIEIIELSTRYLHAMAWVAIPLTLFVCLQQILIGTGETKALMFFTWFTVPVEIFTMYCFIFGKFGIPSAGIAGIGYGMTAAFILSCILITSYLMLNKKFAAYNFFSQLFTFEKKIFFEMLYIGVPIGITYGMEFAALGLLGLFMGQFITDMVAAHQITIQYMNMILMILFGFTQAVTVRVGQAIGEKNYDAITRVGHIGLIVTLSFIALVLVAYWGFPKFIIGIDIDIHAPQNAMIIAFAIKFLFIAGFYQCADTIRMVMAGALRGMKDTQIPMWISIVSLWLFGLPLSALFGFGFNWGGTGLWSGFTVGIFIGAVILVLRFYQKARQNHHYEYYEQGNL